MNTPEDLKFSRSDEWLRSEGEIVTIGISDYAQHELGEVVYLELPEVGSTIKQGTSFGVVESVKAVSELNAPVSGEVVEANLAAVDEPSLLNESPYEEGWLIKVRASNSNADLMDATAYAEYRAD